MLRESILKVFSEYKQAKTHDFKTHGLAIYLRHDFPESLRELAENPKGYKFVGSAGQSKWADCPWVATYDILVTESAQSGYYPVYLFKEDMSGVYLSLNQGITELRNDIGIKALNELASRATLYRNRISPIPKRFSLTSVSLGAKSNNERASFYEAGNICAIYYSATNLPDEITLVTDYKNILKLYEMIRLNEDRQSAIFDKEQGISEGSIEDLTKFKTHLRIERRAALTIKAKKIHGYKCEVCGFSFPSVYGAIGEGFIEAHHLTPLAELKGKVVVLDPNKDFCVLCSNCHAMIHKFSNPGDIAGFKQSLLSE
jgi:5-methylcytosine-specific restriction enzyme A